MREFLRWGRSLVPVITVAALILWPALALSTAVRLMQGRLAWIDSAAEIAYFAGLLLVCPLLVGLACAILIDGWQRLCSWLGWKR